MSTVEDGNYPTVLTSLTDSQQQSWDRFVKDCEATGVSVPDAVKILYKIKGLDVRGRCNCRLCVVVELEGKGE